MSRRVKPNTAESEVFKLRAELEELKNSAKSQDISEFSASAAAESNAFDNLNPVEQSAASLGVSPESWKPIAFLNNAHYEQLIAANMLDDDLARRIEAFRSVAAKSS